MSFPSWKDYNNQIRHSISTIKLDVEKDVDILSLCSNLSTRTNIEDVLGDLGLRLQRFLQCSDKTHPELSNFIKSNLTEDMITEINEIVQIANFCNKKGFKQIKNNIKNLCFNFRKDNLSHGGKTIDSPTVSNVHTRFLHHEKLWQVRENKKPQKIHISKTNLNESDKFKKHDVFACYHHNSEKTIELKNELLRRRKIFESIDCFHLINEVDEAINKLSMESLHKHFGFRRITLSNVAMVYKNLFPESQEIYITPVHKDLYEKNMDLKSMIDVCDYFPLFQSAYSVFDHYGLVSDPSINCAIIVAERDTQTFFLGYTHEQE